MSMEPEFPSSVNKEENPKQFDTEKIAVLEDLFYLGYTKSDNIIIYSDDKKNIEIGVKFRTLAPTELRDVYESVHKFNSWEAKEITEKIETLARAIYLVNEMPLVLDTKDKAEFNEKYDRDPSALEQAKFILIERFSSAIIIDLLYSAYQEFIGKITTEFDDLKKKLKNPTSSS